MNSPAQMRSRTASAQSPSRRLSSGTAAEADAEQHNPTTGSTLVEQSQQGTPLNIEESSLNRRTQSQDIPTRATLSDSGHLGFTSWSHVYKEVDNGLCDHDVQADKSLVRDSRSGVPGTSLSENTLETCLGVLRNLPQEADGRAMLLAHPNPHEGFVRPLALCTLNSLYETFGHCLGPVRDDFQLSNMARILCSNTARPFSEYETDRETWISQFTGSNIRWETLGVLCSYWELSTRKDRGTRAENDLDLDPCSGRPIPNLQRIFRRRTIDCLELSKRFTDVGNTLLLYVYLKRMILESLDVGDTSLAPWMGNGESVALLTFLGLHVEPSKEPYKPSLASEIRRRVLCQVFVLDKVAASITGRPPLLGRRYVLTSMPLDLKDDYLMSDEETLNNAVTALDDKGWNTDGAMYPVTFWRARYQLMVIRDEIFEIALGPEASISTTTLYALKAKELEAVKGMPDMMHYRESDPQDPSIDYNLLHIRLLMRLEHLQNIFFIERLLHRCGCGNGRDLLSASYDMTSTTLTFWTSKDSHSVLCEDFKWLHKSKLRRQDINNTKASTQAMAYAAPGGGILCLELLKPSVTIEANRNRGPNHITRSNIIQLLSMLVGFLTWVTHRDGAASNSGNCKAIVQRVLDQTLNVMPSGHPSADMMEWNFSAQMDFNFDLLDTFEWMRPEFPWADLSCTEA
ncbi:hypothetical protein CCHL11_06973 [Colletotrichum chlorophyti]|uniref:Xylanolytic transcriptional activator regulatory domain-containing protein n=1 Tax=Colletotrichum chlorophyti TaxID=708187 RepID=A0A1Q8RBY2_9PEZI|nr:hypothetical protein CCHL11_06973 [Colletotrichum chlorophyti]